LKTKLYVVAMYYEATNATSSIALWYSIRDAPTEKALVFFVRCPVAAAAVAAAA